MPDIATVLTYSDEEASEACHYLALLRQGDLRTDLCHHPRAGREDFSALIKSTVHPSHCKYQSLLPCSSLDFFVSPNEVKLPFHTVQRNASPTPSTGFPGFYILVGFKSVAHALGGCLKEDQLAIFRKSK
jgi:hypothetical protein